MTGNKTEPIASSTEAAQLHRIISGVIGQECWKAAFSYGGELLLHLGARIPCDHPKMAGQLEGEWIFGTCGTLWTLSTADEQIASADGDEDFLTEQVKRLENSEVAVFQVSEGVLVISFSNGIQLHVGPNDDDEDDDLPCWELFMPNGMMVEFRPEGIWSYRRSDLPVS